MKPRLPIKLKVLLIQLGKVLPFGIRIQMKKVLEKSLLNKIERLEVFEERLGIRFENLSIRIDNPDFVNVFFVYYHLRILNHINL